MRREPLPINIRAVVSTSKDIGRCERNSCGATTSQFIEITKDFGQYVRLSNFFYCQLCLDLAMNKPIHASLVIECQRERQKKEERALEAIRSSSHYLSTATEQLTN